MDPPFEDVFPIKHGDLPASYVRKYQRVIAGLGTPKQHHDSRGDRLFFGISHTKCRGGWGTPRWARLPPKKHD